MLLRFLFAACALAVSPFAQAAEFEAAVGRTGFGRCHMLECGFFVIDDVAPIGSGKDGKLFALSLRSWSNEYRDRQSGDPYSAPPKTTGKPEKSSLTFVYCSKTRAAIFSYFDTGWQSTMLQIGKASAMSGASETAHTLYYAACHRFITRDPVAKEMASKLGYKSADGTSNAADLSGSDDPFTMLK